MFCSGGDCAIRSGPDPAWGFETRREYPQAGPARNHRFRAFRGAKCYFAISRSTPVAFTPASLLARVSNPQAGSGPATAVLSTSVKKYFGRHISSQCLQKSSIAGMLASRHRGGADKDEAPLCPAERPKSVISGWARLRGFTAGFCKHCGEVGRFAGTAQDVSSKIRKDKNVINRLKPTTKGSAG